MNGVRSAVLATTTCCVACVGDDQASERMLPLSPPEAEAHDAPVDENFCPDGMRELVPQWQISLPRDPYAGVLPESILVRADPCGNAVVAYDELRNVKLKRILRDGSLDWEEGPLGSPTYAPPESLVGLILDANGNAVVATDRWLQAFSPAGMTYPGVPTGGVNVPRISSLLRSVDGWRLFVFGTSLEQPSGAEMAFLSLPSAEFLWQTSGFPSTGLQASSLDELGVSASVIESPEGSFQQAQVVLSSDIGTTLVLRQLQLREKTDPLLTNEPDVWLSSEVVAKLESDATFQMPRLAADSGRLLLSATARVSDGEDAHLGRCHEAFIVDVNDGSWSAELPFCGYIQTLRVATDGTLFSLWAVPDDSGPAAGSLHPVLLQHGHDGLLTGQSDLTDEIGYASQPTRQVFDFDFAGDDGAIFASAVDTAQERVVISRVPLR